MPGFTDLAGPGLADSQTGPDVIAALKTKPPHPRRDGEPIADPLVARAHAWADARRPDRLVPVRFAVARPLDAKTHAPAAKSAAPPVLPYGLVEVRTRRYLTGVVLLLLSGLGFCDVSVDVLLINRFGSGTPMVAAGLIGGALGLVSLAAGLLCLLREKPRR